VILSHSHGSSDHSQSGDDGSPPPLDAGAWIFLLIGLIWAAAGPDVLGWGGFETGPSENAMLMPWLTGTAFLHSVMMTEKRGMLKKWNMVLIILTYSLALFGTFITRTGVINSVHAFAKSALGPAFFIFIGLTFIGSVTILHLRWDTLKSEHSLEGLISRESAFVLQNMLFLAITFAVLWGTIFPLIAVFWAPRSLLGIRISKSHRSALLRATDIDGHRFACQTAMPCLRKASGFHSEFAGDLEIWGSTTHAPASSLVFGRSSVLSHPANSGRSSGTRTRRNHHCSFT
jgi:hypothetical protein